MFRKEKQHSPSVQRGNLTDCNDTLPLFEEESSQTITTLSLCSKRKNNTLPLFKEEKQHSPSVQRGKLTDYNNHTFLFEQESPQTVRNAPPVAGAIYWSRQLLKRIEDPMKVFRDNKAITQLTDFGRIVRIYNRLATALVTFESLWFTQWKNRIEQARAGLRATLFVHHPETKEVVVNADERLVKKMLRIFSDAGWTCTFLLWMQRCSGMMQLCQCCLFVRLLS